MFGRLLKFELSRLLKERKLLLLGTVAVIALIGGVVHYLGYSTPRRTVSEAFSFATDLIFPLLLPLLAGIATGDILAKDIQSGLLPLIFSRGVTSLQYVLAKVVTGVIGQVCFVAAVLVIFAATLTPFFPSGPILTYAVDFAQDLAINNPWAYCLAMSLIYSFAAIAFGSIALLVSVWVTNTFAVMVAPIAIYIATVYALGMDTPSEISLNPYGNLALGQFYGLPFTLPQIAVYWMTIAAITSALTVLAFSLKRKW